MSPPVTRPGGHSHAHCNHNHGAEHQLRTLTEHQSNRGSATLAEFQQAAQETTQYRAQGEARAAEPPRQGEVPRKSGSPQRSTAKRSAPPQESSRFQGVASERGAQWMAQSRTPQSSSGRIFQPATSASQPAASIPTPTPTPASAKLVKTPASQLAQPGSPSSAAQSGSTQQSLGNGAGAKPQLSSHGTQAGENLLSKGVTSASGQASTSSLSGPASGNGKPAQASLSGTLSQGSIAKSTLAMGLANGAKVPAASTFATAFAHVRGLSLAPGKTLPGGIYSGQGLGGSMGQVLGFGNGMPFRGLFTNHSPSLKNAKAFGVPLQPTLMGPTLGAFQTLRSPGMFQQLEHSLLNFSNLLFGNYLKGLPQTKLTPNEMMLQQLAVMLAAEQKKRETFKKQKMAKIKTQVEKKNEDLATEDTNQEEEFIQHFEKMMEILKRYRTPNLMIEQKE